MRAGPQQQKLMIGTRIAIRNRAFEVAYVDHMTLRYTPCEGGRSQRMPVETFWALVDDGIVGFCGPAELRDNSLQLWQLTAEQCDEMHRRHKYVATAMLSPRKIMAASNLRRTVQIVAEKLGDLNPPSRTTLTRWLQIFAQSGGNPKHLLPRHSNKGRREMRFCFEIEAIVQETIRNDFLTTNRESVEQIVCNISGKISERSWVNGPAPSRSSIYRRAAALDPYIVALKRYGAAFANMRFRAAGASLEATRPLQTVMMDGHRMDVLVVDTETGEILGRPYLVCLLDVASRAIVGWHISLIPFCATTALAAIKDTCSRDPSCGPGGVPEVIIPDNGPDLASQAVRKLCMWLGVHIEPAKAYSPDDKAHIERFFRTVNTMLIHLLPGTTFSSPSDRGEYQSNELACLTLDDVKEKFEKWLTTVYHVHANSNRAPIMAWRDLQSSYPILHFSATELDVVARVVHRRAINKGRVLVNHLYYKSDCLATLEARGMGDVTVLVDEMDLGFVYVQHDSDPKMLYRADATRREYTRDLTQYEHVKVLGAIKKMRKDDLKALGEHTYELARWELWKDIQKLNNTRSARRLQALKSQKEKTKWKREERKNQQVIITELPMAASDSPSAPAAMSAITSLPYENQTFTL